MRKQLIVLLFTLLLIISFQPGVYGQKKSNFSFVFMTDIHVEPENHATEGFIQAIDKINKLKPDFVITGGDLIMDALGQTQERADSLYRLYLETQKRLKMPVYNTPGNHEHFGIYMEEEISRDHPDYADGMYKRYMGKTHYSFNHEGWHFIILNSIMETEDRHYRGGVSENQIEWLKSDLANIDSETPIAMSVHIPLITAMTQYKDGALEINPEGIVINNSKEVLDLFKDKNLKLVLQGHLHFLEDLYLGGKTHFITGGAVCANWWRGPRGNMEEGFLKIHVKGDSFTWEYIDFGWEAIPDN